jgi:hypothetical protein
MRFRLVPIVLTMTAAAWGAAVEPTQPFTWWTTHSLAKVKPLDPVPGAPV